MSCLPPELIHQFVQYLSNQKLFKYLLATYATNTQLPYHIWRRCWVNPPRSTAVQLHWGKSYSHEAAHWCISFNEYDSPIDRLEECFSAMEDCKLIPDDLCKGCRFLFKKALDPDNIYLDTSTCKELINLCSSGVGYTDNIELEVIIEILENAGFDLLEHYDYMNKRVALSWDFRDYCTDYGITRDDFFGLVKKSDKEKRIELIRIFDYI